MTNCSNCGAELGLGRFCTNCGTPVASMTPAADTPEATATFSAVRPEPPVPQYYSTSLVPAPGPAPIGHRASGSTVSPVWVTLLVLALVAAAALGTWLATRDPGSDSVGGPGSTSPATTQPTGSRPIASAPSDDVNDLAPHAQVTAPAPLPPGRDLHNQPVSYPASNMLDDDPESAYRVSGDATGAVIRFQLPQATTITEVGLVNGYTKADTTGSRTVDWYVENRRILRVEWSFDDGTAVEQTLDATIREIQAIEVPDVKTKTIELTILEVSAPGSGPLGKNVTAISDVLLLGG